MTSTFNQDYNSKTKFNIASTITQICTLVSDSHSSNPILSNWLLALQMRINPTLFETFPRAWTHPVKSTLPSLLKSRHLTSSTSRTTEEMSKAQFVEYGIDTTQINTAPGVEISESQKLLTGSVLDVRIHLSRFKVVPMSHVSMN